MNTPGTKRDAQPASIDYTACYGAILVNDGGITATTGITTWIATTA